MANLNHKEIVDEIISAAMKLNDDENQLNIDCRKELLANLWTHIRLATMKEGDSGRACRAFQILLFKGGLSVQSPGDFDQPYTLEKMNKLIAKVLDVRLIN